MPPVEPCFTPTWTTSALCRWTLLTQSDPSFVCSASCQFGCTRCQGCTGGPQAAEAQALCTICPSASSINGLRKTVQCATQCASLISLQGICNTASTSSAPNGGCRIWLVDWQGVSQCQRPTSWRVTNYSYMLEAVLRFAWHVLGAPKPKIRRIKTTERKPSS